MFLLDRDDARPSFYWEEKINSAITSSNTAAVT